MTASSDIDAIADELIAAADAAQLIEPISARHPDFDTADAYDVLARIAARRQARGWVPVGRKIGFTNRTIWSLYGVDAPMWAHVWDTTVHAAVDGALTCSLAGLVQPRIEPEVVFRLRGPVPATDDPAEALSAVDALAAGFEIVQCHYPGWKFTLPDCTASFGLHGALVIGQWVPVGDDGDDLVERLATFEATLRRDGDDVDRGVGENVLGSPAHALAHLARVLATQLDMDELAAGEVITTGTVTDAWPIAPGETWTCDYGTLGVHGVRLTFT